MKYKLGDSYGCLTPLPGNTQVGVSHSVFIPKYKRGRGKATDLNRARQEMARDVGYDYLTCTVCSKNTVQKTILVKAGWKKLDAFDSRRTDNIVEIWGVDL